MDRLAAWRRPIDWNDMGLIDRYLPSYDFVERHACEVQASPDVVIAAAAAYQPESDPFFRRMIALREVPMRGLRRLLRRGDPAPASFGMQNFLRLDEVAGSDLVYGLVGRFWRTDYGLVRLPDGEAFRAFAEPGVPKLALAFSAEAIGTGRTRLSTETRILCPDRGAWLRFAPYWYVIRPVSGLIRSRILASIKRQSESAPAA